MNRLRLAVLIVAALAAGCAGSIQGRATVSASVDIKLPIADMPAKYASWVVEADGYLQAVSEAYGRYVQARADLAAALGVADDAGAIAQFIRDAIKVETEVVCQPPSFSASVATSCRAEANARASGRAGSGQASGEATSGIQANCEAKASLGLSPGSCTMSTTVSEHPILSDRARWARIEANMKIILQLSVVNKHLDGRGAGINQRGMQLHVESVTDLAGDPTLAVQLPNIQAELEKGATAVGAANDKQSAMNDGLGKMAGAIDDQFPSLRASVSAR